jgi:hypothetical protein
VVENLATNIEIEGPNPAVTLHKEKREQEAVAHWKRTWVLTLRLEGLNLTTFVMKRKGKRKQ